MEGGAVQVPLTVPEVFVSHRDAALTPVQRLRIGRFINHDGWSVTRAAMFFYVSWPTAKRWADRYAAMGRGRVDDRSSRPHRSLNRTSLELVRNVVLTRCRLDRLHYVDVRTGEPIRHCEHEHPGALIQVDVKKLKRSRTAEGIRSSDASMATATSRPPRGAARTTTEAQWS